MSTALENNCDFLISIWSYLQDFIVQVFSTCKETKAATDNVVDVDSEEEETRRKRVGFEVVDDEEKETIAAFDDDVCRLQRKDTPHHLKGKRIVMDDDSKLQDILLSIRRKSEDHENEDKPKSEGDCSQEDAENEGGDALSNEQIENKKKGSSSP